MSFNKYLSSIWPGTVVGLKSIAMSKTDQIPSLNAQRLLEEEKTNKYINNRYKMPHDDILGNETERGQGAVEWDSIEIA